MFSRLKQKLKEESLTSNHQLQTLQPIDTKKKSFDDSTANKSSNSSSDETSETASRDYILEQHKQTIQIKLDDFKTENEQLDLVSDSTTDRFKLLNASLLSHIETLNNEIIEKLNENDTIRMELSRINNKLEIVEFDNENYKEICIKLETDIQELKNEKDDLIIKNAELSQKYELLKLVNNTKTQQINQVTNSEQKHSIHSIGDETLIAEQLYKQIDDNKTLRDDLNEKNKMIKNLQQRLNDMKKTLQRELKYQSLPNEKQPTSPEPLLAQQDSDSINKTNLLNKRVSSSCLNGFKLKQTPVKSAQLSNLHDDVNFKYLKHVVFKFLTSREYEAIHLVKALSVLLNFSNEEEKALKETLEWKMSWFGSRPQNSIIK